MRNTIKAIPSEEFVRFLKKVGFIKQKGGGKGSHEKWKHPQVARSFILPRTKEISHYLVQDLMEKLGFEKSDITGFLELYNHLMNKGPSPHAIPFSGVEETVFQKTTNEPSEIEQAEKTRGKKKRKK